MKRTPDPYEQACRRWIKKAGWRMRVVSWPSVKYGTHLGTIFIYTAGMPYVPTRFAGVGSWAALARSLAEWLQRHSETKDRFTPEDFVIKLE